MKTSRIATIGIVIAFNLAASAPAQRPVDSRGEPYGAGAKRISLAYLPADANIPLSDIPWPQLTHVSHAFLQADETGAVLSTPHVPSKELTAAAHENNVRVLVSLGGGDSVTAFEKITTHPELLARYVRDVVAVVEENGYDGVDIDWEFPRNEMGQRGFVALAVAMRQALSAAETEHQDNRHYELAAAISADDHFGRWLDAKTLREEFDFLNVMTYDMSGPWDTVAAHHAPLFPSESDPRKAVRSVEFAMTYWRRKRIPNEKLCIGIPLYGRMYPVGRPNGPLDPSDKAKHKHYAFSQLRALGREGWTAKWDHTSSVPWMFSPNGDAIIAFDDRNSVEKKAEWAREQGFRGMFFWALPQDRMEDGKHWLINAAVRAWPE